MKISTSMQSRIRSSEHDTAGDRERQSDGLMRLLHFRHSGVSPNPMFSVIYGLRLSPNRRPPRDPVNGLLSLCYVIAGGEILQEIRVRGLDPSLGFFHALLAGRESLMLDILEPLRPETDRFVFGLLDNPLTVGDFTSNEKDGCRLAKDGRKSFYHSWAIWLEGESEDVSLRKMIKDVIRDVVAILDPPF